MLKYTRDHEWLRIEGDIATVGITPYAQEQLGDLVFVELPQSGSKLERGTEAAIVESVKAASDVYSPIGGGDRGEWRSRHRTRPGELRSHGERMAVQAQD